MNGDKAQNYHHNAVRILVILPECKPKSRSLASLKDEDVKMARGVFSESSKTQVRILQQHDNLRCYPLARLMFTEIQRGLSDVFFTLTRNRALPLATPRV